MYSKLLLKFLIGVCSLKIMHMNVYKFKKDDYIA
jgi:hypothetical protein